MEKNESCTADRLIGTKKIVIDFFLSQTFFFSPLSQIEDNFAKESKGDVTNNHGAREKRHNLKI